MDEDGSPGLWALMFWHFHGLEEIGTASIIGQGGRTASLCA